MLATTEGDFSSDALAGKYVVLYFYPRDNTPGCTIEAQDFRDAMPALTKLGAVVLGVSKDSIASHCKFRDKYGLTFPLLTDADGKVMAAYDAWGEKSMYGRKMMGIIRSTVLIGPDGKVVRHWPKVSVKGHAAAVVAAIEAAIDPAKAGASAGATTPAKKTPAKKAAATPAKKAPRKA